MNIQTIILLAALLCAESVNGTPMERFLMVETVLYRSQVSGKSIEMVVYQPSQYNGIHEIDLEGYQLYRNTELQENIGIVLFAMASPVVRVSNFVATGVDCNGEPCEWEQRCEIVAIEGQHTFYLCEEWMRQESLDSTFGSNSSIMYGKNLNLSGNGLGE